MENCEDKVKSRFVQRNEFDLNPQLKIHQIIWRWIQGGHGTRRLQWRSAKYNTSDMSGQERPGKEKGYLRRADMVLPSASWTAGLGTRLWVISRMRTSWLIWVFIKAAEKKFEATLTAGPRCVCTISDFSTYLYEVCCLVFSRSCGDFIFLLDQTTNWRFHFSNYYFHNIFHE